MVIVGAGPAGLSTAIRLKQLAEEQDTEINVCIIEKGVEVGIKDFTGKGTRLQRGKGRTFCRETCSTPKH